MLPRACPAAVKAGIEIIQNQKGSTRVVAGIPSPSGTFMSKAFLDELYETNGAFSTDEAIALDKQDTLSCFRDRFVLPQGIYLDGMILELAKCLIAIFPTR